MRKSIISIIILFIFIGCNHTNIDLETNKSDMGLKKLPKVFQIQFDSLLSISSPVEQKYFKELYSLMPLEDKLDYTPNFHYLTLKVTLKARQALPWGKDVPEKLFKHFILPQRVNNANLDSSRIFFYKELENRLEGKSMLEAAMEINHYCHEHVTYQASSERTSSPMTTFRNGYGRCGEESVFVVAALRTMCIPARQVYTPRWAHTDDNHAWVEFWADGKWYYYGATEPMALPNMGWFTEPARRAMLVGTRINGKYDGDERINYQTGSYTVINTTPVYAPTKEVFVKVIDEEGNPKSNASVDFQIYNYAEFFTLGPKKTNKLGLASFLTGLGDLLVWATDGKQYAMKELDVRKTDTLILTLNQKPNINFSTSFDYNPPYKPEPLHVNQEGVDANKIRLHFEDSLRKVYEATFPDSSQVLEFISNNEYSFDKIYPIIVKSRGNWKAIEDFLTQVELDKKTQAVNLLEAVSEKDMHDVTANILMDHLMNTKSYDSLKYSISEKEWNEYVLNPRVEYEMLSPYRAYLIKKLKSKEIDDPEKLFIWMRDSLKMDTTNYSNVPISAIGSFESGLVDGVSRDLIFIEACRSMGIPARLETGSLKPQYYMNNKWITKDFYNIKLNKPSEISWLHLINGAEKDLQYYKHFTIAKWKFGKFYTLEYEWDKKLSDFPEKIKLEPGYYRITIGNRQLDGSVLGSFIFFEAKANQTINQTLSQRTQMKDLKIIGQIDINNTSLLNPNKKACTIVDNQIVIAIWIDPLQEPSKHIIQDINKLKASFEKNGNKILLITSQQIAKENLDPTYFNDLPSTASFVIDSNWKLLQDINNQINISLESHLPVVTLINPKGEIVFLKMGYAIGIGDEILQLIK